jgi:UDP-glucose 4-epimerase
VKILITGSRGFVGDSFGRIAAREGHEVLGISRSSQPEPGWPGRHFQADAASGDLAQVIRDFAPDLLLQAAGSASVGASIADPVGDFRATAVTLTNVLDGVRRSGREPLVVFPSSAAVYGNPAVLPVTEDAPCSPISPYGFHKLSCEIFAREYAACFGVSTVVCRLFSVFGQRQRRLLVSELYEQFAGDADTVQLQGTGKETRDFLHVDDLARAILLLAPAAPRRACTILNMAAGVETPVLTLAESIRALVAPEKKVTCRGIARPGDPARWCADISRLRALIPGWQPQGLAEALAMTIGQWRASRGFKS